MEEFNERDLFAAFAMNGLVVREGYSTYLGCAKSAYDIADALMNEKRKRDAGITAYGGDDE
jgi:hypothetical protein